MEIDIRTDSYTPVYKIRFSKYNTIVHTDDTVINIVDEEDYSTTMIFKKDIDNLILALQKAKELWGGK